MPKRWGISERRAEFTTKDTKSTKFRIIIDLRTLRVLRAFVVKKHLSMGYPDHAF
jgi:hypothetical protein